MKSRIKNIVFDMGNVLTVYHARDYIYGYVQNEEDYRWIKDHLCASVEWLRMDRGTMSDDEAVASVCRRMPAHLHETVERFVREYRMVQPPNPPMERLVEELCQKGYDLYLMSNTSHRFRIFSRYIKSIAYMKGIWISCEHGLLKPEPEAYLDFFGHFHSNPRRVSLSMTRRQTSRQPGIWEWTGVCTMEMWMNFGAVCKKSYSEMERSD